MLSKWGVRKNTVYKMNKERKRIYDKEYRKKLVNIERRREYNRTPEMKAKRKEYFKDPEKIKRRNEKQKEYRLKFAEENKVRDKTKHDFPLKDKLCKFCNQKAQHHHHYTKPYEFDKFWYVCIKHHLKIHMEERDAFLERQTRK